MCIRDRQKGEGKETYHTFKLTKRAYASFLVASLVKDGGKTSYKIQKSEKGKWVTIGRTKTFNAMSQKESDITAVSYTHLDVYKRQNIFFCNICGWSFWSVLFLI